MYEDIIGYQRAMAQMGATQLDQGADGSGQQVDAYAIRQVQQPQMSVAQRDGLRLQRQWFGFPRTKICAGETVRINGQAQVLMKIIRLYIPDGENASLLVHELTIAKNNLVNGNPVSATIFSPLAQSSYPQTATETIQPGCSATLVLENIGEVAVTVSVSCDVALAW